MVTMDGSQGFTTTITPEAGATAALTVLAVTPNGTTRQNRYTVPNPVPLLHDKNGNLINDGEKEYRWDAVNRLVGVRFLNIKPDGVADTVIFTYNGIGQRVGIKETHGGAVLANKTFIWCGTDLCEMRNGIGAVTKQRFFTFGEQQLLDPTAGDYLYSMDHLGSVRESTSLSGEILGRFEYDPWGRGTRLDGEHHPAFGFAGLSVQKASGLNLTLYRGYSPILGRWLSRDPLGDVTGQIYEYVGNGPVVWIDPLGLASLVTDIAAGTTTFDPRPEDPKGAPYTIKTLNRGGSAHTRFTTQDIDCPTIAPDVRYGPGDAYINTNDARGRDIHGGGTSLGDPGAFAPRQRLTGTRGCTRGHNADIREICRRIKSFQRRHPGVRISYTRR
jgi:RHS repeat-associated protein